MKQIQVKFETRVIVSVPDDADLERVDDIVFGVMLDADVSDPDAAIVQVDSEIQDVEDL